MGLKLRGWKKLAGHYSKAVATVREWDCPCSRDGTVHVFDTDEVDAWLAKRSDRIPDDELFDSASGHDREALLKVRIRKTKLEADALERKKKIEDGLFAPVDQFEKATTRMATQLKQVMVEQFNELLDLSDLPPADKEKLQAKLIDGFNEIANLPTE